jgi:glucosamine--fructose-6-phosphate aminotransferase (isomerizing)
MVEASELLHYQARLLNTKTLIVIVSQSGQSAEVVRLLEENAGRSKVIAITNTPDSPLAKQSDAAVITRAGSEYSVSCKTYVTALMALQWLAEVLCGGDLKRTEQELQEASSAVDAYLLHWKTHAQTLCSELKGIRHLFLVGRGPSLAAVGTGALIIKESDHFPAEGMSSAAFRHGPLDMVNDESFVMIFSGDDRTRSLNRKLLDDVRARRGRANLVCENAQLAPFSLPAAPACVQPILEILPVEMVTLALAAQEGREPGRFEFATKITTTE